MTELRQQNSNFEKRLAELKQLVLKHGNAGE